VADYFDDKVILSINEDPLAASSNLQTHLNQLSEWYEKWRVKINLYIQRSHSNKEYAQTLPTLNNVSISTSNTVRYLGLTLNKIRLT
jgi:hypothetical protein